MNNVVHDCESLTQEDTEFLERIEGDLGILADLSRADVLMYCPLSAQRAVVVAQAKPHSILPIYGESVVERQVTPADEPAVFRTLVEGRRGFTEVRRRIGSRRSPAKAAPIVQETYPIRASRGRVIAAVSIETNLIERERHRRRSKVFHWALRQFQETALAGELRDAHQFTPFAEHDGVMVVDAQRRIQYVSGIATSLYRKLGFQIVGRRRRYYRDSGEDAYIMTLAGLHSRKVKQRLDRRLDEAAARLKQEFGSALSSDGMSQDQLLG